MIKHDTYSALNRRVMIAGVEWQYFFLVGGVFIVMLLTVGDSKASFLVPGGVYAAGYILYDLNPHWFSALLLHGRPELWHKFFDARRRP